MIVSENVSLIAVRNEDDTDYLKVTGFSHINNTNRKLHDFIPYSYPYILESEIFDATKSVASVSSFNSPIISRSVYPYNTSALKWIGVAGAEQRKSRTASWVKLISEEAPSDPPSRLLSKALRNHREALEKIRQCFEDRPALLKSYLRKKHPEITDLELRSYSIKFSIFNSARILPVVGFYFLDGPWRSCWVKYGYDPRSEPGSWKYQVIEIRGLNLPETELSKYYLPHGFIYPHRESTFDGLHLQGTISQIQYLDITFPPALKLIDSSRSSEFSIREGWFKSFTSSKLRSLIKKRSKELLGLLNNAMVPADATEDLEEYYEIYEE